MAIIRAERSSIDWRRFSCVTGMFAIIEVNPPASIVRARLPSCSAVVQPLSRDPAAAIHSFDDGAESSVPVFSRAYGANARVFGDEAWTGDLPRVHGCGVS